MMKEDVYTNLPRKPENQKEKSRTDSIRGGGVEAGNPINTPCLMEQQSDLSYLGPSVMIAPGTVYLAIRCLE